MQEARANANFLFEKLQLALVGFAYVNFVKARRLRPLALDLPSRSMVSPTSTTPNWAPPKGAVEFIGHLAMLCKEWEIPRGENAGQKYSGIHAANDEIAKALGISPSQWRRKAYVRDGHRVAMPGTREWLMHHELVEVYATTERRTKECRDGELRPFGDGRLFYQPGRALLELLGIHRRRVRRNRRRVLSNYKAWLRRNSAPVAAPIGRQDLPTKGSGGSFSEDPEKLPTVPPRTRACTQQPLVRQKQLESPVGEGVGAQVHRRAPAAPSADRRHVPCSSQNKNEPDGHEGPGCAGVAGELETSRQRSPLGVGDAITPTPASLPSPPPGIADALALLSSNGDDSDVRALVDAYFDKHDPDGKWRRRNEAPPAKPPASWAAIGAPAADVIAGFGEGEKLVARVIAVARGDEDRHQRYRQKLKGGRPRRGEATVDERAERRRKFEHERSQAIARAQLEATRDAEARGIFDDDVDDIPDLEPDDVDGDGGAE